MPGRVVDFGYDKKEKAAGKAALVGGSLNLAIYCLSESNPLSGVLYCL